MMVFYIFIIILDAWKEKINKWAPFSNLYLKMFSVTLTNLFKYSLRPPHLAIYSHRQFGKLVWGLWCHYLK
jgi:hypothetical protein